MPRNIRCGLVQTKCDISPEMPISDIRAAMVEKHGAYVKEAADKGVRMLCFQELMTGPYFPAEEDPRWYNLAEPVPDGPTIQRMRELAKKHGVALIIPLYEREMSGVYYNTAAAINERGEYLGKYRKVHIPYLKKFSEKFYFKPGNLGFPVFEMAGVKVGVYICYDRHFPEGARALGLNGAEVVFIPAATTTYSRYLWELEQTAHAVANGYYVGTINRIGREAPWNIGDFYGTSYFCDPKGAILTRGSQDREELVVADLDLDVIHEVRSLWQYYRDRRPDAYKELTQA
ncbi:MAG: acyltransferase [Planctomycetes bacterium]|nr:acyltransferase [Planctomycetota bacterium]